MSHRWFVEASKELRPQPTNRWVIFVTEFEKNTDRSDKSRGGAYLRGVGGTDEPDSYPPRHNLV